MSRALLAAALLAGCRGATDPGSEPPPPPSTSIELRSDPDDYIGQGRSYRYTRATSDLAVTVRGNRLSVSVEGDEWWSGEFRLPASVPTLRPGTYPNLTRFPFEDPAVGGMNWSGEGRGCNTLAGSVTIDAVTYVGDSLATLTLRFVQHCDGRGPALRGAIHWRADDATRPAGPVVPPPADLWRPSSLEKIPATGDYLYLESQPGDYIGQGLTTVHLPRADSIRATATGGLLQVAVGGWSGAFQTMRHLSRLAPGYYRDLSRHPFHNPARGGLSWSGNGSGCNTLAGWFVVDHVRYVDDTMTGIALRFEQRCEGGQPALHGALRWGD